MAARPALRVWCAVVPAFGEFIRREAGKSGEGDVGGWAVGGWTPPGCSFPLVSFPTFFQLTVFFF
jgi:hypothetical protein